MVVLLAKSPLVQQYDLSHVETIGCGGASLNKDIEKELKDKLGVRQIKQGMLSRLMYYLYNVYI